MLILGPWGALARCPGSSVPMIRANQLYGLASIAILWDMVYGFFEIDTAWSSSAIEAFAPRSDYLSWLNNMPATCAYKVDIKAGYITVADSVGEIDVNLMSVSQLPRYRPLYNGY